MIRSRRMVHRWGLTILALLIPLLAILGLRARRTIPTTDQLPFPPKQETVP
jgi:hypothetical protein